MLCTDQMFIDCPDPPQSKAQSTSLCVRQSKTSPAVPRAGHTGDSCFIPNGFLQENIPPGGL